MLGFQRDFCCGFPTKIAIFDKNRVLGWISDAIFLRSNTKSRKSNIKSFHKSLRNCPNRCQQVSKAQCKKPAKFQTAVSICQFLCPGMLVYIHILNISIYTWAVPSYQRRPSSPRKREGNVRFATNLHGVRRSAGPTSRWAPKAHRMMSKT